MKEADGIVLASPVYFSGVAGTMKSFLDRAFFVSTANNNLFRHKVGASVAAVRRSGGLPTVNSLNHYNLYSEMIMPGSNYWNVAHGMHPGEMDKDAEGKQIMEVLGRNMAWLLKIMEKGKDEIPAERGAVTYEFLVPGMIDGHYPPHAYPLSSLPVKSRKRSSRRFSIYCRRGNPWFLLWQKRG